MDSLECHECSIVVQDLANIHRRDFVDRCHRFEYRQAHNNCGLAVYRQFEIRLHEARGLFQCLLGIGQHKDHQGTGHFLRGNIHFDSEGPLHHFELRARSDVRRISDAIDLG